jgi:hypothetical protein
MPVSIPARASVSLLRGALVAETVASSYRNGRRILALGEVRTGDVILGLSLMGKLMFELNVFVTLLL